MTTKGEREEFEIEVTDSRGQAVTVIVVCTTYRDGESTLKLLRKAEFKS